MALLQIFYRLLRNEERKKVKKIASNFIAKRERVFRLEMAKLQTPYVIQMKITAIGEFMRIFLCFYFIFANGPRNRTHPLHGWAVYPLVSTEAISMQDSQHSGNRNNNIFIFHFMFYR